MLLDETFISWKVRKEKGRERNKVPPVYAFPGEKKTKSKGPGSMRIAQEIVRSSKHGVVKWKLFTSIACI